MEIDTQKVMNGAHIGEIVWICHYHRPDMNKKPLRNIPPTRVIVRSNDDLPKNKTIYYSYTHFCPINESGKRLSKFISPVDNTGFRSKSGTPLYIFDDEQECNDKWNSQIEDHAKILNNLVVSSADFWIEQKNNLLNQKK